MCHSPLCILEVIRYCIHTRYNFFAKLVQIQYFLVHFTVNLSFMVWFMCLFILNII